MISATVTGIDKKRDESDDRNDIEERNRKPELTSVASGGEERTGVCSSSFSFSANFSTTGGSIDDELWFGDTDQSKRRVVPGSGGGRRLARRPVPSSSSQRWVVGISFTYDLLDENVILISLLTGQAAKDVQYMLQLTLEAKSCNCSVRPRSKPAALKQGWEDNKRMVNIVFPILPVYIFVRPFEIKHLRKLPHLLCSYQNGIG